MKPEMKLAIACGVGLVALVALHASVVDGHNVTSTLDALTGGFFAAGPTTGTANTGTTTTGGTTGGTTAQTATATVTAQSAVHSSGYTAASGATIAAVPSYLPGQAAQGWIASQAGMSDIAAGLTPAYDPLIMGTNG